MIQLPELIHTTQQYTATQYVQGNHEPTLWTNPCNDICVVAVITLYTADYLHTLPAEINHIWPAPWTFVKFVFVACRYSPFVDAAVSIAIFAASRPSTATCRQLLETNLAYGLLGPTRIKAVILSLFALVVAGNCFMIVAELQERLVVQQGPMPIILPGCVETSITTSSMAYAIAAIIAGIAYETILFLAICWARLWKYQDSPGLLLKRIYRDAFVYYFFSLGIVLWFATTGPIVGLSSWVPRFLVSIVSCRIVIHIREYAFGGEPLFATTEILDIGYGSGSTDAHIDFVQGDRILD
ncbi:hypothetical protein NP233_g10212 [Leucocoprinus birnbaumii]|uniref:DUF6533 domain-containing protein n=1 Tax=Leucocoprinus birnbaumii TaxID=56174 RepID=A0AAD5YLI6_9AGAR|nr:hypothetical protein NP233_g10212 [Leucocoprinus birnbaumii]